MKLRACSTKPWLLAVMISLTTAFSPALAYQGAAIVSFYGYDDCIRLSNERVTVTLCPAAGGRVLEYSLDGTNVLYLPPGDEGWRQETNPGRGPMNAGRFDIGPEKVVERGLVLWQGEWEGEIIADRAATLTSQFDPVSGVRLIRQFELDHQSSRLRCTQTIINESDRPVSLCHWSRTFAVGGGVAVVPRSPRGRFPVGYVMYSDGNQLQMRPQDSNIHVSDDAVLITGPPEFPKLGFDSHAGWLAYAAPTDQLFIKRFQTFPNRSYNELAGLTVSVWYPRGEMVELEPIGPAENLDPGERSGFSEEWWLVPHEFPESAESVEFREIEQRVRGETVPALSQPEPPFSPEVHADRRVTFRFTGEDAETVAVRLDDRTIDMSQEVDGLWTVTLDPLSPGIYDYTFEIDGTRVTDPRNRWLKKWKTCSSLFEVPGKPPLITERQTIAHGTLHRHIYDSPITNTQRDVIVYTPPGYGPASERKYPLLVLLHGNGDDESAWTEVGRAHLILDNLIAAKKIDPMIVVMPHGHPVPLTEHRWSEDYKGRNRSAMVDDIVHGVLPFVEEHYAVMEDPAGRAITGLSMGGGQAIATAMSHPKLFQWVGAFSAGAPEGDLQSQHPRFDLSFDANSDRKLFWIACGRDDSLLEINREFSERLTRLDIDHRYLETDGSHNWDLWREYLPQFLQLIFRQP